MAKVEMREVTSHSLALTFEGIEDARLVVLALKRLREDNRYSPVNDRIFARATEMLSDIDTEILDVHGAVISVDDGDSLIFGG